MSLPRKLRRFDQKWLGGRVQATVSVLYFALPLFAAALFLSLSPLEVEPPVLALVWGTAGLASIGMIGSSAWRYVRHNGTTAASERAMRLARLRSESVNG